MTRLTEDECRFLLMIHTKTIEELGEIFSKAKLSKEFEELKTIISE